MINVGDLRLQIHNENETMRSMVRNTHMTYPAMDPATLLLAEIGLALYDRLGDLMMIQVQT